LLYSLKEGILKGAALDVLEEETEIKEELELLVKYTTDKRGYNADKRGLNDLKETAFTLWQNHILMKMPNVLITPHNAFNSKEAIERILMTTIENIKKFLEGNSINLVK
jgi:D-lactate dehydrogenase